ncbi:MAG: formylmethanofuran dehydrogenase, subunit G [Promethearchaeota archaeon CR_4]|nr:MAG: formylmethanofuran dehydrogenase, subunit G [Candidatus Lokiarchaeota archaeon CR_4]
MGTLSALEIYKLTPKTNCKKCGKTTCMAFAMSLVKREVKPEDCPPLLEAKYAAQLLQLKQLLGPEKKEGGGTTEIDAEKCDGCAVCVVVCPVSGREEFATLSGKGPRCPPDPTLIYQVVDGKCKILQLDHCRRFESTGEEKNCRICEKACPQGAITIKE